MLIESTHGKSDSNYAEKYVFFRKIYHKLENNVSIACNHILVIFDTKSTIIFIILVSI